MKFHLDMATIGKVQDITTEFDYEWQIMDFFSLSKESGKSYMSPPFSFAGESWYLKLYPNGETKASGFVSVFLFKKPTNHSITVSFSLGLRTFDGKDHAKSHAHHIFKDYNENWGFSSLIRRSTLSEKKSELLPSDTLTIICSIQFHSKSIDEEDKIVTANCSHCKKPFLSDYALSHEQKCLDKPVKCPTCSSVVALKDWFNHGCDTNRVKGVESLCQDFKKVLLDGQNYDLILEVDGEQLQAHRDILRARSHVFESMLTHDMMEKNNGVVKVLDCDLEAMKLFLSYVYTGQVETLDQSNMLELYYVADKYEMEDLKEECRIVIKKLLSHSNICKVIQLALNHSDSNLQEHTTEYFCANVLDIMYTVEWQEFMKNNTTVANELTIKSVKQLKK